MDLARRTARTSAEAAVIADGLWPLDRLLDPGAKSTLPPGAMDAWAATVPDEAAAREGAQFSGGGPTSAAQGREIYLNLFTAFGDPVGTADWLPVMHAQRAMDRGPSVAPHIWNGLTLAARDRRVGEAAALSLIALGDDGPAFAAPETLQKVISTLMAVGREQDARVLAAEAVLALGL
jgi:hypothetical protein